MASAATAPAFASCRCRNRRAAHDWRDPSCCTESSSAAESHGPRERADVQAPTGSAQLVERDDLEVEGLVGAAAAAVGGDGDPVDFAASARHLDRAGVAGRVGVNFEPLQLAAVLAAEGDHPAVIAALLPFF